MLYYYPINLVDSNYDSKYVMFSDGKILNTETNKYLTSDYHCRCSLKYGNKYVHKSIGNIYYQLFNNYYHGNDLVVSFPNEQWKEIENTKQGYYISNYGRIKSFVHHPNGKLLVPYIRNKVRPYYTVNLYIDKQNQSFLVSRLVAKYFLSDTYSEDKEIHHINLDTLDNRVENLVCLTREEHIKIHNEIKSKDKEDDSN